MLGETAVVLELEPPVTLESQKRIWRLAQRLADHEEAWMRYRG
jgi:allophanate hydrolase subunit 1